MKSRRVGSERALSSARICWIDSSVMPSEESVTTRVGRRMWMKGWKGKTSGAMSRTNDGDDHFRSTVLMSRQRR